MSGRLIVIEGLDGSGKATQAKRLAAALADRGLSVREISFPNYESDSSALVRMYLRGDLGTEPGDVSAWAASLFFTVDRYAGMKQDWGAFYQNGGILVADRYTTSNAVHQCCKLPEEQWDAYLDWLFHLEYRVLGLPEPDLVLLLVILLQGSVVLLQRLPLLLLQVLGCPLVGLLQQLPVGLAVAADGKLALDFCCRS